MFECGFRWRTLTCCGEVKTWGVILVAFSWSLGAFLVNCCECKVKNVSKFDKLHSFDVSSLYD